MIVILSDGNFTYTYDNANRLTTVTNKTTGLVAAAFAYDENGKRVKKTEKRCDNFIYVLGIMGPENISEPFIISQTAIASPKNRPVKTSGTLTTVSDQRKCRSTKTAD